MPPKRNAKTPQNVHQPAQPGKIPQAGEAISDADEDPNSINPNPPPVEKKPKPSPDSDTAGKPKRSAAWLEKEADHQSTLAEAVGRIDQQLLTATGIRREYLLEARKAFVGRPHDDPAWRFILTTTKSVDDTLSAEEGLHFLRGINAKKPLTIISGSPLE